MIPRSTFGSPQPMERHARLGDEYFVTLRRDLRVGGVAGAGAQRESLRRANGRPWTVGAGGERVVGRHLDPLSSTGFVVLHDRRIPGSRANIDHVALGPAGVYVIDAKSYTGRIEQRGRRLFVNGRDRSNLLEGLSKQVWEVEAALARPDIPVHGVLCFVDGEWPLLRRPLRLGNMLATWPADLVRVV